MNKTTYKVIIGIALVLIVVGCTQAANTEKDSSATGLSNGQILNENDTVKSTAQNEGQFVRDLVDAIKKSFDLS